MSDTSQRHEDARIIEALGGATQVARLLGYSNGGVQRVHNWKARGIPPAVKIARPDLFLPGLKPAQEANIAADAVNGKPHTKRAQDAAAHVEQGSEPSEAPTAEIQAHNDAAVEILRHTVLPEYDRRDPERAKREGYIVHPRRRAEDGLRREGPGARDERLRGGRPGARREPKPRG